MSMGPLVFKTITVATDFSDSSSAALRYSQAIARQHRAHLVLVHVIDPEAYAFPEGAPEWLQADAAAREELAQMEREARRQGIAVDSVMEAGTIHDRILQAVKDHQSDLLVLGTSGKTSAGRVALGRVARQLLAKAPCPVMAISPEAEEFLPYAGRWQRVLVATDFSAASVGALLHAHQMAGRQLTALHVSRCHREGDCCQCVERLRFLAPFNESHTVPVEHIVRSGEASNVIAEHAWKMHADLVVLGSPVNFLSEEEIGSSTVLNVISKVKCPVLCVPRIREEAAMVMISDVALAPEKVSVPAAG